MFPFFIKPYKTRKIYDTSKDGFSLTNIYHKLENIYKTLIIFKIVNESKNIEILSIYIDVHINNNNIMYLTITFLLSINQNKKFINIFVDSYVLKINENLNIETNNSKFFYWMVVNLLLSGLKNLKYKKKLILFIH